MSAAPHQRFAIVVPIVEGAEAAVEELLDAGPPFDPAAAGLDRHEVFVTSDEVIFVFESRDGIEAVEAMLAEPRHGAGRRGVGAAHGRPAAPGTARLHLVAARGRRRSGAAAAGPARRLILTRDLRIARNRERACPHRFGGGTRMACKARPVTVSEKVD